MITLLISRIVIGQNPQFTSNDFIHSNLKNFEKNDLRNGSKLYNNISIECDFDTLYLYNTNNIAYKRITNTFDNNGNLHVQTHVFGNPSLWENNLKYTFSYDSIGNKINELEEYWSNTSNAWINSYRVTFNYDINRNLLSRFEEKWLINAWVNDLRISNTYNTYGKITSNLHEDWGNSWNFYYQYTYTYDTAARILTETQQWKPDLISSNLFTLNTYNEMGRLDSIIEKSWVNNTWQNSNKTTNIYNNNGSLDTILKEGWQNNTWENYSKISNTYDVNGYLSNSLSELWQNNAWTFYTNDAFTNDISGRILSQIREWYPGYAMFNFKNFNTYDTYGNLILSLFQKFENNSWVNSNRLTYNYFPNGFSYLGMLEGWINSTWILSKCSVNLYCGENIVYTIDEAKFEVRNHTNMDYINENEFDSSFLLFPNPATNKLTIDLQQLTDFRNTTITIYNNQGQLILQQDIYQSKTELDVTKFCKGIYVIKLINNKDVKLIKFLKE